MALTISVVQTSVSGAICNAFYLRNKIKKKIGVLSQERKFSKWYTKNKTIAKANVAVSCGFAANYASGNEPILAPIWWRHDIQHNYTQHSYNQHEDIQHNYTTRFKIGITQGCIIRLISSTM